jgi:plasmid stabilization system protein ParE
MKVQTRPRALQDLTELATYIAKDNLPTAERFLDAFEKTLDLLAHSPLIGNPYPFRDPRSRISAAFL